MVKHHKKYTYGPWSFVEFLYFAVESPLGYNFGHYLAIVLRRVLALQRKNILKAGLFYLQYFCERIGLIIVVKVSNFFPLHGFFPLALSLIPLGCFHRIIRRIYFIIFHFIFAYYVDSFSIFLSLTLAQSSLGPWLFSRQQNKVNFLMVVIVATMATEPIMMVWGLLMRCLRGEGRTHVSWGGGGWFGRLFAAEERHLMMLGGIDFQFLSLMVIVDGRLIVIRLLFTPIIGIPQFLHIIYKHYLLIQFFLIKNNQKNKNILYTMLDSHNQQKDIQQYIRRQSWRRFQEQYRSKFKKIYDDDHFAIVSSISVVKKGLLEVRIIVVGTGTKSLPFSLIDQGNRQDVIDDMHAEMLALRGFKRFILQQLSLSESTFLTWDQKRKKYVFNQEYELYLYCSQLFCGDCCINEDHESFSGAKPLKYLYEKVYLDQKYETNVLRTKPGRLDIPIEKRSHLLSCSDLIGFANILGIQGKTLFSMIHPIYLDKIILDGSKFHEKSINRGINMLDRLKSITNKSQILLQRQIFNIVVEGKERRISWQFKQHHPKVIIMQKSESRNRQGFQLCGIFTEKNRQWINGKTGLPEGSSLKNYKQKGRTSLFSQSKLLQSFPLYRENAESFKYKAIQDRLWYLFGQSFKDYS